ncbi:hypothetical protein DGo_PD0020 (plasmid) [Deinococcus gobiensis I-0]|uniref:Uncharacterized protein n=1 Tax=Deinococcus gobiensis (strain DSM 21396 / JCM 16679 / CGMCC 1.7299 / I-0) TaxID=745776 RepID=H8H3J7_DEIGI|nr:hypothetical protein DGo_PD0020 [Deinococcus gobiensis I-0]
MSDPVLFSSLTVRQAVVDDTQRLWIAFEEGFWLWVDLAGYLENQAVTSLPPYNATQEGMDLRLSPQSQLSLPLLFQPTQAGLEQGICVCAIRRSKESWYRPLRLTGVVSRRRSKPSVHLLTRGLTLSADELRQAAQAHAISVPSFLYRLDDLCHLLEGSRLSVSNVFHAPWQLTSAQVGYPTLWAAILNGQIGLVEQVIVAKANRKGGN